MLTFLCNGCRFHKKAVMKIAHDNEVCIVIGGSGALVGSEDEPKRLSCRTFVEAWAGVCDRRLFLACRCFRPFVSESRVPELSYVWEAYPRFWLQIVIGLFDFLEWNEAHIVDSIRHRFGWTKPFCWNITWWANCNVHWLKKFLCKKMLGFTKNNEFFSDMVREEMITMEETLTRPREADNLQENFLAKFMAEHGVKFTWLRVELSPVTKSMRKQITRRYTWHQKPARF